MDLDWTAAGTAVRHRRAQLRISQREAAQLARLSPTTWGSLETNGNKVEGTTAAAIAYVLGWTSDSIERAAQGLDPIVIDPAWNPRAFFTPATEHDLEELRQRVVALEDWRRAVDPDLKSVGGSAQPAQADIPELVDEAEEAPTPVSPIRKAKKQSGEEPVAPERAAADTGKPRARTPAGHKPSPER